MAVPAAKNCPELHVGLRRSLLVGQPLS